MRGCPSMRGSRPYESVAKSAIVSDLNAPVSVAEATDKFPNFGDLNIQVSIAEMAGKNGNFPDLNIPVSDAAAAEKLANFATCPPRTGRPT
jgi:hypothetical protein